MFIIYSEKITARLNYAVKIIFKEVLSVPYKITDQINAFGNAEWIRINYSDKKYTDSFQIVPAGLLHEAFIVSAEIKTGRWQQLHTLFAQEEGDLPFDLFSAIFYLVSRYEEYIPFVPDAHGRFEANHSLAFCEGFLKLPIVDLWCKNLADLLGVIAKCPGIQRTHYQFELTVDVDQAWWYKEKGIFRTVGSLAKDLLQLHFHAFAEQLSVVLGRKSDPAYNFEYLKTTENKLSSNIQYFILAGKRGKYDPNISLNNNNFRNLIGDLDKHHEIGIHPSYASNLSYEVLQEETRNISFVVNHPIRLSRQHFLIVRFPQTYRNLIKLGIEKDYSLGYASQCGFRAGIARSFNFFDLGENKETNLRLVPFEIMDRTQQLYQRYSPEDAIREYHYFTETIRDIGGEFTCLWHNNSLSDTGEWEGWLKVFEEMVNLNLQ